MRSRLKRCLRSVHGRRCHDPTRARDGRMPSRSCRVRYIASCSSCAVPTGQASAFGTAPHSRLVARRRVRATAPATCPIASTSSASTCSSHPRHPRHPHHVLSSNHIIHVTHVLLDRARPFPVHPVSIPHRCQARGSVRGLRPGGSVSSSSRLLAPTPQIRLGHPPRPVPSVGSRRGDACGQGPRSTHRKPNAAARGVLPKPPSRARRRHSSERFCLRARACRCRRPRALAHGRRHARIRSRRQARGLEGAICGEGGVKWLRELVAIGVRVVCVRR